MDFAGCYCIRVDLSAYFQWQIEEMALMGILGARFRAI